MLSNLRQEGKTKVDLKAFYDNSEDKLSWIEEGYDTSIYQQFIYFSISYKY